MNSMWRTVIVAVALSAVSSVAVAQSRDPAGSPEGDRRARYAKLAELPDWSGVWSPDWLVNSQNRQLKPEYTKEGAALVEAYEQGQERGENLQGQQANCVPPGLPNVMTQPYPIEFVFTPGAVYIITETYSQVRRVYTDGRPLPDDPDPYFNGHSIGHWDGQALIVETNGINPRNVLVSGVHATEQTRIREKIWQEAPDQLIIETTISDPTLFTKPFVTRAALTREHDWEMREYVCAENNKDAADPFGRPSMSLEEGDQE